MAKLPDSVAGARVFGSRMVALHKQANPNGQMPLMDHVRELRSRVVKAALAIVIGMGIGLLPWVFSRVWNVMERPYRIATQRICSNPAHRQACLTQSYHLIVTGIFDPFSLRIEVAFFFALVVTSPIWFYQLWAFISPALYSRERRWAYMFVGAAVPLFLIGTTLAYIVMGRGLQFLLALAPTGVTVLPTITTYMGYLLAMVLGFGLTFELPLVLVLLNLAHVLTHQRFRKWRRVMIFTVFLFAGIATPSPDPITMLLLAAPCVVLVEVAEVIVWANDRRLARRPGMYEGLSDFDAAPLGDDDRVDSSS
jgi:sec-independent protein translocase protein TatC